MDPMTKQTIMELANAFGPMQLHRTGDDPYVYVAEYADKYVMFNSVNNLRRCYRRSAIIDPVTITPPILVTAPSKLFDILRIIASIMRGCPSTNITSDMIEIFDKLPDADTIHGLRFNADGSMTVFGEDYSTIIRD